MIGNVYRILEEDLKGKPKHKYEIVIGLCPDLFHVGVLLINSKHYGDLHPELLKLQYLVSNTGCFSFLKYPSYVDCSRIVMKFGHNFEEVQPIVCIGDNELRRLIDIVVSADTIERRFLKLYQLIP